MNGVVLTCSKGHLIALDIIRGLVFLHSNKVVHADLKAKNVLLTQNAGKPHPSRCTKHTLHLPVAHRLYSVALHTAILICSADCAFT